MLKLYRSERKASSGCRRSPKGEGGGGSVSLEPGFATYFLLDGIILVSDIQPDTRWFAATA